MFYLHFEINVPITEVHDCCACAGTPAKQLMREVRDRKPPCFFVKIN